MVVGHLQCVTRLNLQTDVFCNFPHILLNWLYQFLLIWFRLQPSHPRRPPLDLAYVLLDCRTALTMFTPLDPSPYNFVLIASIFFFLA